MKTFFITLTLILSMAILSGCHKDKSEIYAKMTDREIYTEAVTELEDGSWQNAIEAYEQLDAQYPFGKYTEQGQLEVIYAYYMQDELPAAMAAADRFIRLHPRNTHVDYAYYMRGMIKFTENRSFIDRILPIDRGTRDLTSPRTAYTNFAELVRLFPDSPYSPDARQRMLFIRNVLAHNELNVAQWYIRREAYVAAANRAQFVVEHYPETPSVPEAMRVMVIAYQELGLDDLAETTIEVLQESYPESAAARSFPT